MEYRRIIQRVISLAGALLCLGACAGATDQVAAKQTAQAGTTDIAPDSTIAGLPVNFTSAIYAPAADVNGDPVLLLWLSSVTNICDFLASGSLTGSATLLTMQLTEQAANGSRYIPAVGATYKVSSTAGPAAGAGRFAALTFYGFDFTCAPILSVPQSTGIAGGIDIFSWPGTGAPLRGAVHAAIGANNQLIDGNFTAVFCAALASTAQQAPSRCIDTGPGDSGLTEDF